MKEVKSANIPLAAYMNLSHAQSPKIEIELREMKNQPYANTIGSVMFSMITTRPDLAYAMSFLNRFMSNPGKPHLTGLKWLLRYIARTLSTRLVVEKRFENLTLKCYVDSNFTDDKK